MYRCKDCGEIFDDPATQYEYHPYGMGYAHEEWAVCPCCRDTDFEEVEECERCGEVFPVDELCDGLCDTCYDEVEEENEEQTE